MVAGATDVDSFGPDSIMTLDESHAKDLGLGVVCLSDEETSVFLHGLPLFRLRPFLDWMQARHLPFLARMHACWAL